MNRDPADASAPEARVRQSVCRLLAEAEKGLTPFQAERTVSRLLGVSKKTVRREIRALVGEGRIGYGQRNGTSFLEPPAWGPVRVSDRIWLSPPGCSPPEGRSSDAILIRMRPGAAFGLGDHPTTRLALRGLEVACAGAAPTSALDIGTGTGVLGLAAARMGASRILALDTDPCARTEAAANAAENGLAGRIAIADMPFDRISGVFDLILANLRPPTLSKLAAKIGAISRPGSLAVLSGFRPAEWPALSETFRGGRWRTAWLDAQKGWSAAVCRKV